MVDAARRRAAELGVTNAEFHELDAEPMDLAAASVDGVVCRWGYMLMADPGVAFGETFRVMRPGGRLAVSVFGAPGRNPWASLVGRILIEEGHAQPPAPGAPGIFALSDVSRIRELLARAGFDPPDVVEVSFAWDFATSDAYWRFLTEMAGAISPILRALAADGTGEGPGSDRRSGAAVPHGRWVCLPRAVLERRDSQADLSRRLFGSGSARSCRTGRVGGGDRMPSCTARRPRRIPAASSA